MNLPIGPRRRMRALTRLWRVYLLRLEYRLAPSEVQRLFLLTLAIGAACGLAAVAFHLSISFVEGRLLEPSLHAPGHFWMIWTVATPMLGGIACGALLQYVVPNARGSGIPQVKTAFASTPAVVPLRDAAGKFVVGALQIGSGASLGREGPTVQICAGIASWLGRLASVSDKSQRRLLPVGVAAGIAAAFNAPIAAVTFTIEEIVGSLDQAILSGVIVAAALAAVIERSLVGESAVFSIQGQYGLRHASSLLLYAAIGFAAAAASIAFTESLLWLRKRFRESALPGWLRPGIGGATTGLIAVFALLTLGSAGITGGGYETLARALNGNVAWRVMLVLSVLKLAATSVSYASGGAGGIFAPSLFIGGTLGGAIGMLDSTWLGHAGDPIGAFVLVGMGAMFAGVIRAPITSVLIIVEMTSGYSLILPLMIANMTAYVIARRYRQSSIYEALLEQDGIQTHATTGDRAGLGAVGPLIRRANFDLFSPATTAEEVLSATRVSGPWHVYPVVDFNRRLLGVITADELAILESNRELSSLATAADLMRPPFSVRAEDDIAAAVEAMLANGVRELPVIDGFGRLVGVVDDKRIAHAYKPNA